jgi:hypothetical protein
LSLVDSSNLLPAQSNDLLSRGGKLERVMFFAMFVTFAVPPLGAWAAVLYVDRMPDEDGVFNVPLFAAGMVNFSFIFFGSLLINTIIIVIRLRGVRPFALPLPVAVAELVLFVLSFAWLIDAFLTTSDTPWESPLLGLGVAAYSIVVFALSLATPRPARLEKGPQAQSQ